jgi:hypothetical protein
MDQGVLTGLNADAQGSAMARLAPGRRCFSLYYFFALNFQWFYILL